MKTITSSLENPQLAASAQPATRSSVTSTEHQSGADIRGRRRGWLLGVGAAGAAGAAVLAIQKFAPAGAEADQLASQSAKPSDYSNGSGGYQLTQHVLRYYETTRS